LSFRNNIAIVILAAGKGTRMRSGLPKVLTLLDGRPLLSYVIDTARAVKPEKIVIVVGHKGEQVVERFAADDITFVTQEPQLGTGHAALQACEALKDFDGDVVALSGDVPLVKPATIERLIVKLHDSGSVLSVLTLESDNPGSYGRILRKEGKIVQNVEAKDATAPELEVNEINCGIYAFKKSFLIDGLERVGNRNAQGEYYLTDLINIAVADGLPVASVTTDDPAEAAGVNTVEDLKALER